VPSDFKTPAICQLLYDVLEVHLSGAGIILETIFML
jgi:hypothetical protein